MLCGKKILVVDDNRVNRRVAAGALKKFGADVECAESGKAALALLELPHNFDACFMDIQMPEMDDFQATRHIRKMEKEANEPQQGRLVLPCDESVFEEILRVVSLSDSANSGRFVNLDDFQRCCDVGRRSNLDGLGESGPLLHGLGDESVC
ncbi:unnamed protein product [Camellia sinensis]